MLIILCLLENVIYHSEKLYTNNLSVNQFAGDSDCTSSRRRNCRSADWKLCACCWKQTCNRCCWDYRHALYRTQKQVLFSLVYFFFLAVCKVLPWYSEVNLVYSETIHYTFPNHTFIGGIRALALLLSKYFPTYVTHTCPLNGTNDSLVLIIIDYSKRKLSSCAYLISEKLQMMFATKEKTTSLFLQG